jgi:hypothetical protein
MRTKANRKKKHSRMVTPLSWRAGRSLEVTMMGCSTFAIGLGENFPENSKKI